MAGLINGLIEHASVKGVIATAWALTGAAGGAIGARVIGLPMEAAGVAAVTSGATMGAISYLCNATLGAATNKSKDFGIILGLAGQSLIHVAAAPAAAVYATEYVLKATGFTP